ncbi:MAG: helix-turn-helix domain-containing protein [Myxococcales bacterium]|nr:helix-turn-helix domain-containing protein [Myxococcales bacterium]MCB9732876.1 helix-turn-helix domain-containing protein [Deltaproteobacteria bacterium]
MNATPLVLTPQELAQLLRLDDATARRLVDDTSVPRFTVNGAPRFITDAVIAWLAAQEGEILPPLVPVPVREAPPTIHLPPASAKETPFVASEALDALAEGATDPGRNLDRLKLRDALLELNSALLPVLGRLSGGRLHPHGDEKVRTSPWRLDEAPDGRIDAISIAWGGGEHPPAGFVDRARVEVEVGAGELRVALLTRRGFDEDLTDDELEHLRQHGIAVDTEPPASAAKVYPLGHRAPSLAALAHALSEDLELLVPLWAKSV